MNNENPKQLNLQDELEEVNLKLKQAKAKELEAKLTKSKLKVASDKQNAEGLFGTPTEPRKSLNSFLRNQNKFLVSSIAIFDRKAALLIKITTATISALIAFHEYIDLHVVNGYAISIILLIGLLLSLILSIISTKPHITLTRDVVKKQIEPHYPSLKYNIFSMFSNAQLKEYEEAMKEVVTSQDLQLGNQIRANYIIGMNNRMDAILLSYSYNIFLFSFLIAGLVFILSRFAVL